MKIKHEYSVIQLNQFATPDIQGVSKLSPGATLNAVLDSIGSEACLLQYASVDPNTIAHPTSISAIRRSPSLRNLK
jgi:hypothetical protein